MATPTVREDQLEWLVTELDRHWRTYCRGPERRDLNEADRAELRRALEASKQRADATIVILEHQPGKSSTLQWLEGKLRTLTALAEGDLQGQARR